MEEKIFEQKVTKVTKGRESQRTFILCGLGRLLAQRSWQSWPTSNLKKGLRIKELSQLYQLGQLFFDDCRACFFDVLVGLEDSTHSDMEGPVNR